MHMITASIQESTGAAQLNCRRPAVCLRCLSCKNVSLGDIPHIHWIEARQRFLQEQSHLHVEPIRKGSTSAEKV